MTGAQFDTARFILVPLTPLHIGGGEEAILTPEDFRAPQDPLERVDLRKVLLRENAVELVRKAGLDIWSPLKWAREKAREEDIEERIAISTAALREFKPAFERAATPDEQSRGQINAFQRSAGRPVLPGSSLKGALRTAWLAYCSVRYDKDVPVEKRGETAKRHKLLTQRAFQLDSSKQATDADPMRDVTVSDAMLPKESTLIDSLESWKERRGRYSSEREGKMLWERTRSVVDGGKPPCIKLSIGVRRKDIVDERRGMKPGHAPSRSPATLAALLAALNAHHEPLWTRELEKYFPGAEGQRLRKALCLLNHLRRATDPKADPDAALIRIGRGGHAESKSVATHREVQIKKPGRGNETKGAQEGSTRHVVRLDDDGPVAPFGWALLVRKDRWRAPSRWLPRLGGHTPTPIWRKGQKVLWNNDQIAVLQEDVWETSDQVEASFDGETETINVADITGPAR